MKPKNDLTVNNNLKFNSKRGIEAVEGITGQTSQRDSIVYLKLVPADYVKITSDLGEANLRNILVVPLKLNEKLFGVMEILL